jgi:hypothetical protein
VDQDRAKDMKIKITVVTLCTMLFALSYSASAQQTGKIFRIGYLIQALLPVARSF